MVVALIALLAALGGGAYAAATITGGDVVNGSLTGKDVKNGSLPGKKLKGNSVTGRQVKESSLGKVPSAANADTLGGQPASSFDGDWVLVQGSAAGATVLAQSGGISVQRLGLGAYSVDLGESAVRRPLLVTLNAGGGAGSAAAAPCGGTANNPGGVNCGAVNDTDHVLVQTLNAAAATADRTFYLLVGPA